MNMKIKCFGEILIVHLFTVGLTLLIFICSSKHLKAGSVKLATVQRQPWFSEVALRHFFHSLSWSYHTPQAQHCK